MGNPTGVRAPQPSPSTSSRLSDREQAEGYVAMVCFKHGPPRLHGVELERTLHDVEHPTRPVDIARLRAALGDHTPATVDPASPHIPLTHGSLVTVEPGGQVEISTPPHAALDTVIEHTRADSAQLVDLLGAQGLSLGGHGLDPHRPPRRILTTPRYTAMEQAYVPIGPGGAQMMCSSASLQVCLDAGEATDIPSRWAAVHALGPPLIALFANSRRHAGADTRWASARLRSVLGTCPPVTLPPAALVDDPARHWARLAMEAPVICLRRDGGSWAAPAGLSFAAWIEAGARGELPVPTTDDLDYHLSTMFPPVRPRGYLEIRYLDAQPGDDWVHPFVLVCALMSSASLVDAVLEATEPARDRWLEAGRHGLEDPSVRTAAAAVVDLGCAAVADLDLAPATVSAVLDHLPQLVSTTSRRCSA
jgi:glutamate--cysteine ligase